MVHVTLIQSDWQCVQTIILGFLEFLVEEVFLALGEYLHESYCLYTYPSILKAEV